MVGLRMSFSLLISLFSEGLLLKRITRNSSFHILRIVCSTIGVKLVVITKGNCRMESNCCKHCDGSKQNFSKILFT